MQHVISFLIFFLLSFITWGQGLDGTYYALELNSLNVDTSGKVDFYMRDSFPKARWFHEVRVTIRGSAITLEKYPVQMDYEGNKRHSASDGGFLTYKGQLTRSAGVYVARAELVAFDYIGFSLFEPPLIVDDLDTTLIQIPSLKRPKASVQELRQTHDVAKGVNGMEVFLPKGTLRKDLVLRPAPEGVWINNVLHYRRGGKAGKSS